jgi:hypothetical protein
VPLILPDVPGVVRVVLNQSWFGLNAINQFHLSYIGSPPLSADLDAAADSFIDLFSGHFQALQHDQLHYISCDITDLSSTSGARGAATGDESGTRANDALTANTAWVISWKIDRRYRGGHPRSYMWAMTLNEVENARTIKTSVLADMNTAASNFKADLPAAVQINGDDTLLVNVSYFDSVGFPSPPHLRTTPVVDEIRSATVGNRVDSQRRRTGREL